MVVKEKVVVAVEPVKVEESKLEMEEEKLEVVAAPVEVNYAEYQPVKMEESEVWSLIDEELLKNRKICIPRPQNRTDRCRIACPRSQ